MDQETPEKKHHVFLAVPMGGDGYLSYQTHRAIAALALSKHSVACCHQGSSALVMNFNAALAEAVNRRMKGEPIDTFAMIHSDISVKDDWLDRMLEIFDGTQADVLSAIIPIKDEKGLTSTAFDTSRWTPRRLTMTEAMRLPTTFDGDFALEQFKAPLLLNTGLMLIRFTDAWARDICFDINHCMADGPDGLRCTFFEPEDWHFSRWCNARKLKLVATREVPVHHLGNMAYSNTSAWGTMAVDSINLTNSALGERGMIPKG